MVIFLIGYPEQEKATKILRGLRVLAVHNFIMFPIHIKEASIISSSRKREISEARGIICYLAVNDMGYSASEVAYALEVRRVSAGQCVTRGEKIFDKNRDLRDKFIK